LHRLAFAPDPNLLAGVEDDAAVYRLREDLAIVVSVDYFTPIVKEAYLYGQIAADNALSDIYAMGAKPIIALNIVCFPAALMGLPMLEEVLKGSSDKLKEAGVHACTDVTGFGLAGHLLEMIRESKDVGIEVDFSSLRLFPRVEEFAEAGLIPPGSQRNRKFYQEKVSFSEDIAEWKRWIVFDAQTSGGLILSIPEKETGIILRNASVRSYER
jgi:selenophosphate synthase